MAERYLIDTSAVIKYLKLSFSSRAQLFIDSIIDDESNISFITEIELQAWKPLPNDDISVYVDFIDQSNIYGLSDSIIRNTIEIRRDFKLKVPDALIAATALTHGLTLIADNDKDFLKVKMIKYINPAFL